MDISGNKMLHLKQDLAFLRQRLAECSEESAKQSIRREIMEKETYYNILADRQRIIFRFASYNRNFCFDPKN